MKPSPTGVLALVTLLCAPVLQADTLVFRDGRRAEGTLVAVRGDPFFIGDSAEPIRMRATGRLFLGINDDHVLDNSGVLRVVVSY